MNSIKLSQAHSHYPSHAVSRRGFLGRGAALAGAAGMGNLLLAPGSAHAADYKALVCVFLYGGNDGMNMVVPTDSRYDQYAAVRRKLAIPKANLAPLAGVPFALHPSMKALTGAWNAGAMAPVFNVGPLHQPLTKSQYLGAPVNSTTVPGSLFSHSDQQVLWETGSTDPLGRTGWGGRAAEALATTNPVISLAGSARFGLTELQTALVLPGPGATFGAYNLQPADLGWAPNALRKSAIDALYGAPQSLTLGGAYTTAQSNAFAMSTRLASIVATVPGGPGASSAIDSAFAPLISSGKLTTPLAAQLYQVAKLIANNTTVQGSRQLFFTSMGGFDTHGNQVVSGSPTEGTHAKLLKQLGDALGAFYTAMKNLGLDKSVTAFTESDFGRTFAPNSSMGTDHAWGNHHLVIGDAVIGGTTYGSYPELVLGGSNDVGQNSWELQGRWIPTSSVDQYAATLLGWFGASDQQLDTVLPNLKNFGTARRLGFL